MTKEMLNAPDKRLFVLIGGLEAVSQLLGFIGASKLPGTCSSSPVDCCSPRRYAIHHILELTVILIVY